MAQVAEELGLATHATIAIVHMPLAAFGTVFFVYARPSSALRRRRIDRRTAAIIALSSILSGEIGSVLFATSPLFAMPLAVLVLRDRVTIWAGAGTGLAIAGIGLLA